jgi:hypothetical protein
MKDLTRLWLVRPNLGSPLILEPGELARFTITLAYRKPWDAREATVEWLDPAAAHTLELSLARGAGFLRLVAGPAAVPLSVHKVHGYSRHPAFEDQYGSVQHAVTSAQQQYVNGFRWEVKVDVGIPQSEVAKLKGSRGWPALLHLESRFDPGWNRRNWHAVYVHETLKRSADLTILQITDLHVAKRNDRIPEILCQLRHRQECDDLRKRYIDFNDRLRAFVREANARVRGGENVLVVATGDLTDYYFDGYWDGKFVCGQDGHAPVRTKEAAGSGWNSNVKVLQDILTGQDGKSEALQCPIFTILGNHDYYANEILLNWQCHLALLGTKLYQRDSARALGLTPAEGVEYDFWAFPRLNGKYHLAYSRINGEYDFQWSRGSMQYSLETDSIATRKVFKEFHVNKWKASLDQDWSYWLIKPKSWILSQYLCTLSYDLDFQVQIGNRQLLFLNTGHDRYPSQEDLALSESEFLRFLAGKGERDIPDWVKDFVHDGPHARGISAEHLTLLEAAFARGPSLVLVFTHAPLVGLERAPAEGVEVLFEESVSNPQTKTRVANFLRSLYGGNEPFLRMEGFNIGGEERWFKKGPRAPYLDFYCADSVDDEDRPDGGNRLHQFLDRLTRAPCPVLVLSGHTHKAHEFRIGRSDTPLPSYSGGGGGRPEIHTQVRSAAQAGPERYLLYYMDRYTTKHFSRSQDAAELQRRADLLPTLSPLLLTSGGLKAKTAYREIAVRGRSLASLEMRDIDSRHLVSTCDFSPGCFRVSLRAHNGQYVRMEEAGSHELTATRTQALAWEALELVKLEGAQVALRARNGRFVRAEGGGGGRLKADREWIRDHEAFTLVKLGGNKIALRAHNGQYVCAEGGGGRELVANRDQAREWETFQVEGEVEGLLA